MEARNIYKEEGGKGEMSGFQGHDRDFSEYSHMSTDDLEAILRADFELPESEESDMEKILYITEVIAQRRAGQPTGRYANEDEAWDSFVENYCPEPAREVLRGSKAGGVQKPRGWRRILARAAVVAAVFVLVVAAGTVSASAFGFNFWEWLTGWSREIFNVQDTQTDYSYESLEIPEQLLELQEAMEEYGFPDKLLPTYLPDGYEMTELNCDAMAYYVHLTGNLKNNGKDPILLDYYMYLDEQPTFEVQKDGDGPVTFESGGVTHYIMTNLETYYATWTVDNVVCIISGFTSYDELSEVIESIYSAN